MSFSRSTYQSISSFAIKGFAFFFAATFWLMPTSKAEAFSESKESTEKTVTEEGVIRADLIAKRKPLTPLEVAIRTTDQFIHLDETSAALTPAKGKLYLLHQALRLCD